MNNTEGLQVTAQNQSNLLWGFTQEQVNIIKSNCAIGATDSELSFFLAMAKERNLNPLKREIYLVIRGKGDKRKPIIQTGIDGFRAIASRTGKYKGQTEIEWAGADGVFRNYWSKPEPPMFARVGVLHADFQEPLYRSARFDSYKQEFWDYDKKCYVLSEIWKKMPELMLAKCAEALALRAAFPEELAGLYTNDEMEQAETVAMAPQENGQQGEIQQPTKQPKFVTMKNGAVVATQTGEVIVEAEVVMDKNNPGYRTEEQFKQLGLLLNNAGGFYKIFSLDFINKIEAKLAQDPSAELYEKYIKYVQGEIEKFESNPETYKPKK